LIGRTLSNALLSLGIYEDVNSALEEMGLNPEELIDEENDPGLGNGGLGRLPASSTRWRRWVCRPRLRYPLRLRDV
jgi:glucan phosphorylase